MPGIGAFISAGRSLDTALERVRKVDELGLDGVYVTQIAGRDALILLTAYASVSQRVRLGYSSSPAIASGLRGTRTARLNSATRVPSCL
jgi:alkanesulfonate monooxygenase SsuD/methylene tetrahydromethanopterin reductase-like flavin-dependent oxidoreductase (luciferase family)